MSGLSKEEKQKLNEFIDSIELGTSTADTATPYKNTLSVWKVPIIGHAVTLNTKNNTVDDYPLLDSAFDFDTGLSGFKLGENLKIEAVLPPLKGEHVIQASVPSEPTSVDNIIADYFEDCREIVTLCHCASGVPETNWKQELREQLFEVAIPNITHGNNQLLHPSSD